MEKHEQRNHHGDLVVPVELKSDDARLPNYDHKGLGNGRENAGADMYSSENVRLEPGESAIVPVGVGISIPVGYGGFVHPRSSLSGKGLVVIPNSPGTIDPGYIGEVKVCLLNLSKKAVDINEGDRTAQLVVQKVEHCEFVVVDKLDDSTRGEGGFGSTGS